MNVGMAATAVAVVTIGFMGLLLSAQDGEAGNLMFDGASLCVIILQTARYWAEGEQDDGALDSRADSSEKMTWKRSSRPVEPSPPAIRQSRSRASESPSTRRRSPVKRKAVGSISLTK
ncbi:hypothetical protein FRC18_002083 [Serendipita sp. 400]|nr:hypothetical protein FRC18_002083 [Serendipita sp. 400]